LGLKVEVVHHTQLLAHLVATGRLTPVQPGDGGTLCHAPCYLGRHNRVFEAPREVLGSAIQGGIQEMPRNQERSFCCGAGGARMWMEEKIGKRINVERTEEALSTGAKTIAVGCPFCYTMIGDGVTGKGEQDNVEVVDVATVLLRSLTQDSSELDPAVDAVVDGMMATMSAAVRGSTGPSAERRRPSAAAPRSQPPAR